jgi:hypothetical protein
MNWSFGLQHRLSNSTTMTLTYVGSAGRFVYMDATNARGIPSNQLDPKWLRLGDQLSNKPTAANLAAAGITAPFPTFSATLGTINQALRPFPQYNTVTDILGYVGTTSYNALEAIVQRRMTNGLTFMGTYTWSKSMDNAGTFRSGYDIPAQFAIDGKFHPARALDRSLSLSDMPHRVVGTAVYELPFGKGKLGGGNAWISALAGGWKISGIYTATSGAPLGVVMQSCPTNPSAQTCQPFINPAFKGDIMALGGYEHVPANQLGTTSFLNRLAFTNDAGVPISYNYMFSTTARTAPFGMRNSGNYQIDANLKRTFPIKERVRLNFQIDAYNLTNHTRIGFANSSTIINLPTSASTAFGTAGVMNTSRFLQLAARVEF